MSKSFRKTNSKKDFRDYYDDEEENYNSSRSSFKERRQKRRMNNAIRSKNISSLLELDDSDYDDFSK